MTNLSILPECYLDTNLTETLLKGTEVNHQKGCGTVANRMMTKFADEFAVGIIDKDKRQIDYFRNFDVVRITSHSGLYKHPQKHHYVIQIIPAMERFILHAMEDAGLQKADYDIPEDFDQFKKLTKSINRKADPNFKKLFGSLLSKDVPQMLLLKNWLDYLVENRYHVDLNQLQDL